MKFLIIAIILNFIPQAMAADDPCFTRDIECFPREKNETDKDFCARIDKAKKTNPGYQFAYCRFDKYERLTGFNFRYVPPIEREAREIKTMPQVSITSIDYYTPPGVEALNQEVSMGAPIAGVAGGFVKLGILSQKENIEECFPGLVTIPKDAHAGWIALETLNHAINSIGLMSPEIARGHKPQLIIEPLPQGNSRASGIVIDAYKGTDGKWYTPSSETAIQKIVEPVKEIIPVRKTSASPESQIIINPPAINPDPISLRFPYKGFLKAPKTGKNRKIGILPGTFDPIHEDHIRLAEKIREEFNLDEVVLVSNPDPNHKPGATPYNVRSEMLATRIELSSGLNAFSLPQDKAPATNQSLLDYMKAIYPDAEIYQIMGDDVYIKLSQKGKIKAEGTTKYIITRREVNPKDSLHISPEIKNKINLSKYHPGRELSSTVVRKTIKDGEELPLDQIHPAVQKIIAKEGLYLETSENTPNQKSASNESKFPGSDAYLFKFPNNERPYLIPQKDGYVVVLKTDKGDYLQTTVKDLDQVAQAESQLKLLLKEKDLPAKVQRTKEPGKPSLSSTVITLKSESDRRQVMANSDMASADVFTNLEGVPLEKREALYKDPNNWIPERRKFHEELLKKYTNSINEVSESLKKSDFAKENPEHPILIMTRGNSAAGKSSSIKNSTHPIFQKLGITTIMKMPSAKFGILNPDTIKSELQAHDQMLTTSAQEHEEGSMLAEKLLEEALASKKSLIVDKRFANSKSIDKLAGKAKKLGYRIIMIDVDATISNSAQRLTGRVPGGEDPNVPFAPLVLGYSEIRRDRLKASQNLNIDDYYAFNNIAESKNRGLVASKQKGGSLVTISEEGWKEITAEPDPMEFNLTARKYGDMLNLLAQTRPADFKVEKSQDTITGPTGEKINFTSAQNLKFHLLQIDLESARYGEENFPKVGNAYSVQNKSKTEIIEIISVTGKGFEVKNKTTKKIKKINSSDFKNLKKNYLFTPEGLDKLAQTTQSKELFLLSGLYRDDFYQSPKDPTVHEKFTRHFRNYLERYGINLVVEKISDTNYKLTIPDAPPYVRQKFLKNEFFSFQSSGATGNDLILETTDLAWKRDSGTSRGIVYKVLTSVPERPEIFEIIPSLDLSKSPKSQVQAGQEIVRSGRWGDYLADLANSDSLRIIPNSPPLIEFDLKKTPLNLDLGPSGTQVIDEFRVDESDATLYAAKLNFDQAKKEQSLQIKKNLLNKTVENARYAAKMAQATISIIDYNLTSKPTLKRIETQNASDFNRQFGIIKLHSKYLEDKSPSEICKIEKSWLTNVKDEANKVLSDAEKELSLLTDVKN